MRFWHGPGQRIALPLAMAAAVLAACSGQDKQAAVAPIDSNPLVEMIKPKLTTSVANAAVGVSPGAPVTAKADDGKLTKVVLYTPENRPVKGEMAPDGLTWKNIEPLGFNRTYRLEAEAYGLGGATSAIAKFTTSAPQNKTKPYLLPDNNAVVGIGQPVAIQFDEAIPDRVAAQKAINVTTEPPVEGAFYWLSNKEVRWRPEKFWQPGTKVKVDINVYGANLGKGLFGAEDVHSTFTVGDATVFTADDKTHQVTVEKNGQVVKTMPTSMGKDGTPTDNGVYIVGDKFANMVMDSSTYGVPTNSPQGYKTPVDWATRISYSGIFFHSAPWSVGQQGNSNASHGCLNLSPANARWVFDTVKRGDITIVKNTVGGVLSGTDGLGDWNIPWDKWKAGNA